MRRLVLAVIIVSPATLLAAWLLLGQNYARQQSPSPAFEESVVRVFVQGPVGTPASGTGIVVNRLGHVVTNFHVVKTNPRLKTKIYVSETIDGKVHKRPAELVGKFPGEDLAILRVKGLNRTPAVFSAAEKSDLYKGREVFAVGFPGAADRLGPANDASFLKGVVSRTFSAPWAKGGDAIEIIQHSAPINPGNSGGPLIDAAGHVIGVNSQREVRVVRGPGGLPIVIDPIQGLFYASSAREVIQKLRSENVPFTIAKTDKRHALVADLPQRFELMGAVSLILMAVSGIALLYRRRSTIELSVECGSAVGDCADAIERALYSVREGRNPASRISVKAIVGPAPQELQVDRAELETSVLPEFPNTKRLAKSSV